MKTLKSSIFWKIYIVNLLVIFTLLGLVYFKAEYSLPNISKENYKQITDETALRLKDQINNIVSELEQLNSFIQSKGYFQNKKEDLTEQLAEIVTFSNIIDSGTVLDTNGNVIGFYPNDLQQLNNSNLSDRKYFQKVLETKKMHISNVISASTGRFIIVQSIPIFNKTGDLQYVVNLSIRIENNALIKSIIYNYQLGDGYVYIVDQQGRLLSHPKNERIGEDVSFNPVVHKLIQGQSGYERVVNSKNVEMFASYQYVPILNWGIVAQVPVKFTEVYFQAFLQSMLGFSLVLFMILSILTAIYARQLIKPIQKLHQAVDQVATGNFKQRIDEINQTEIGKLSNRFNEMIDYIQHAQAKIKHNEQLLTDQKEFLHQVIDINPNFIYAVDVNGRFTLANKAFADFSGKKSEELLNKKELEFNPDHRMAIKSGNENRKIIDTTAGIFIPEETIQDSNGNVLWVQKSKIPIIGQNGQVEQIICVAVDITERMMTQELIRKSDKLAVVGELAAGVAHEIRNPLTSVKGFLQFLKPKYGDDHYFEIMLSELDRINLIISELLVLSKPQAIKFEPKDIREICKVILDLFESQAILNNVKIETQFESDLPLIQCEENQLKQVFINILKNGMEALPHHGGYMKIEIIKDHDSVVISFTDNGCGISEQRIDKLGEPFYSTKEKGTGLGLMVSYKIIENHRGNIQIQSSKGEGTTVKITLPSIDSQKNNKLG